MMPSICFVSDELYPATKGGIGRLLYENARELRAAGWSVIFLLLTDRRTTRALRRKLDDQVPGCTTYCVDDLLDGVGPDEAIPLWAFHFLPYYQSYRVALALRVLVAHHNIDLIEFADYRGLGYVTLKWRRLLGAPFEGVRCWVRVHGTYELWLTADDALTHSRQERHTAVMERYCLAHADGWLCPSSAVATWYRDTYKLPNKPALVSAPPFERLGPGNTHPRRLIRPIEVLYYGKLQRLKGVDVFVQAAVRLCEDLAEPISFHLVGHEARRDWLTAGFRRKLQDLIPPGHRHRFRFYGPINVADLPALAARCSFAVVPSRVETFCLAAHELNWIGIPLVLRDLPAFRDYFHDGVDCRVFTHREEDAVDALYRLMRELVQQEDPFAGWRWNAPAVVAAQRGAQVYREASVIGPHQPFGSAHEQPTVSVIVPYFNAHQTLEATLESARLSHYEDLEVIVIDDGSTLDPAREAFERLRERYAADGRFRFVRKANGGLSSARNTGLAEARGRYVLPLDADDLIEPDYIRLGVAALERNPELAAVSCFASYFMDGAPATEAVDYVIAYDLDPLLITLENRAGVAGSLFRMSALPATGYAETLEAYEDWDLWWTLAQDKKQAEVIPCVLYRYRRRASGLFLTVSRSKHVQLVAMIEQRHLQLLAELGTSRANAQIRMKAESTRSAKLQRRLRDTYLRWRERKMDDNGTLLKAPPLSGV